MTQNMSKVIKRSMPYWIMGFLCIPIAFLLPLPFTYFYLLMGGMMVAIPMFITQNQDIVSEGKE